MTVIIPYSRISVFTFEAMLTIMSIPDIYDGGDMDDSEKTVDEEEPEANRNTKRIVAISVAAACACAALGVGGFALYGNFEASDPDGDHASQVVSSSSERHAKASVSRSIEGNLKHADDQPSSEGDASNRDPVREPEDASPAAASSGSYGDPSPQESSVSSNRQSVPFSGSGSAESQSSQQQEKPAEQPAAPSPEPLPPAQPPAPDPQPEPEPPALTKHICRTCNIDITGHEDEHIKMHMLAGEDASWYAA